MFLPINDTEPNRYTGLPLVTILLVAVNVLMWVAKPLFWDRFELNLYNLYGSVPQFVINEQGGGVLSSITATFLHADFFHLAGNMLFLWVFGRRVEDACGAFRYLSFYLFCGLTADLLSTLIRYQETIPGIGASGAIAGLLGAYLILFPGGRIRTFLLLGFVPAFPRIRAFWFLIYWLVIQLVPAFLLTTTGQEYSINYWAHIGGFVGGVFVVFFLRSEAFSRLLSNEPV